MVLTCNSLHVCLDFFTSQSTSFQSCRDGSTWLEPVVSRGKSVLKLGDNFIQNFHLGRYIIGYTVVKCDFRTYIRRYTSPNENFEYGNPHSNALLNFSLKKTVKMYFIASIRPAAASCIKPLASCIYSLVSQ